MKRTAVVTGESRGTGYTVARQLGLDGYQIVILATGSRTVYQEAPDQLTKCGITWYCVQEFIALAEDRERLVKESVGRFGRIDILVDNAGATPRERKDLFEMIEESFDRVIGINTKGTIFLTQPAAKQMISQKQIFRNRGHIVNVGPCSAEVSSITGGEHCISKVAIRMLTALFADRLALEGVIVDEMCPGVITTDMTNAVADKYDRMIVNGGMPIACWGRPEDVAQMVGLFCSDKVLCTAGNYIDADGDFRIKRL